MLRSMLFASVLCLGLHAADMPADVAAQVGKFKDEKPQVRQQAMTALGAMGEKAKPALPQILEMLNDKVTWVQSKALMAVAQIGPDESCIKPTAPFLGSDIKDVRSMAADIFVKLKDKGVPELIESLKDEKRADGACEALAGIGPPAKAAAPALTELSTKSKSKPLKEAAAKALKAVNK